MKKVNFEDYKDYTVESDGVAFTGSFQTALDFHKSREHSTLYGNKPNGDRAILDAF